MADELKLNGVGQDAHHLAQLLTKMSWTGVCGACAWDSGPVLVAPCVDEELGEAAKGLQGDVDSTSSILRHADVLQELKALAADGGASTPKKAKRKTASASARTEILRKALESGGGLRCVLCMMGDLSDRVASRVDAAPAAGSKARRLASAADACKYCQKSHAWGEFKACKVLDLAFGVRQLECTEDEEHSVENAKLEERLEERVAALTTSCDRALACIPGPPPQQLIRERKRLGLDAPELEAKTPRLRDREEKQPAPAVPPTSAGAPRSKKRRKIKGGGGKAPAAGDQGGGGKEEAHATSAGPSAPASAPAPPPAPASPPAAPEGGWSSERDDRAVDLADDGGVGTRASSKEAAAVPAKARRRLESRAMIDILAGAYPPEGAGAGGSGAAGGEALDRCEADLRGGEVDPGEVGMRIMTEAGAFRALVGRIKAGQREFGSCLFLGSAAAIGIVDGPDKSFDRRAPGGLKGSGKTTWDNLEPERREMFEELFRAAFLRPDSRNFRVLVNIGALLREHKAFSNITERSDMRASELFNYLGAVAVADDDSLKKLKERLGARVRPDLFSFS